MHQRQGALAEALDHFGGPKTSQTAAGKATGGGRWKTGVAGAPGLLNGGCFQVFFPFFKGFLCMFLCDHLVCYPLGVMDIASEEQIEKLIMKPK